MWVSPFRNLRINGYVLLPEAFRSLSRLSSALSAKASTIRSCSSDLFAGAFSVTHLQTVLLFFHGDYEIRTRDLLLARQALSQLS